MRSRAAAFGPVAEDNPVNQLIIMSHLRKHETSLCEISILLNCETFYSGERVFAPRFTPHLPPSAVRTNR
jgi:hypothetical protein